MTTPRFRVAKLSWNREHFEAAIVLRHVHLIIVIPDILSAVQNNEKRRGIVSQTVFRNTWFFTFFHSKTQLKNDSIISITLKLSIPEGFKKIVNLNVHEIFVFFVFLDTKARENGSGARIWWSKDPKKFPRCSSKTQGQTVWISWGNSNLMHTKIQTAQKVHDLGRNLIVVWFRSLK